MTSVLENETHNPILSCAGTGRSAGMCCIHCRIGDGWDTTLSTLKHPHSALPNPQAGLRRLAQTHLTRSGPQTYHIFCTSLHGYWVRGMHQFWIVISGPSRIQLSSTDAATLQPQCKGTSSLNLRTLLWLPFQCRMQHRPYWHGFISAGTLDRTDTLGATQSTQ